MFWRPLHIRPYTVLNRKSDTVKRFCTGGKCWPMTRVQTLQRPTFVVVSFFSFHSSPVLLCPQRHDVGATSSKALVGSLLCSIWWPSSQGLLRPFIWFTIADHCCRQQIPLISKYCYHFGSSTALADSSLRISMTYYRFSSNQNTKRRTSPGAVAIRSNSQWIDVGSTLLHHCKLRGPRWAPNSTLLKGSCIRYLRTLHFVLIPYQHLLLALSFPMQADDDQCALRADGTLKDASEIEWSHDPDDICLAEPIPGRELSDFTSNTLTQFTFP